MTNLCLKGLETLCYGSQINILINLLDIDNIIDNIFSRWAPKGQLIFTNNISDF